MSHIYEKRQTKKNGMAELACRYTIFFAGGTCVPAKQIFHEKLENGRK